MNLSGTLYLYLKFVISDNDQVCYIPKQWENNVFGLISQMN